MNQEKLDQLFKILAEVLKTIDNGDSANHLTPSVKKWMNENASEYLK